MIADESQQNSRGYPDANVGSTTLTRGIALGVIGSVVGTLAMDLVMVGEFSVMRLPAGTQFALIGSIFGSSMALGVVLHIMMGALLGLVFSVAVLMVDPLRIHSVGRGVGLGVLAGVVTIPFGCVPFAIVARVPILEMVSFSTVPHLVWGVLLGIVGGYGLRSRT